MRIESKRDVPPEKEMTGPDHNNLPEKKITIETTAEINNLAKL